MKYVYSISFFILFQISACSYTQLQEVHRNSQNPKDAALDSAFITSKYFIVSDETDSVLVSNDTKYFYGYRYGNYDEWKVKPELTLANSYNHGINVIEAWYHPGANHTGGYGKGPIGWTMVPPSLIIGISNNSLDNSHQYFEALPKFDPIVITKSRWVHYIFKGIKKGGA